MKIKTTGASLETAQQDKLGFAGRGTSSHKKILNVYLHCLIILLSITVQRRVGLNRHGGDRPAGNGEVQRQHQKCGQ